MRRWASFHCAVGNRVQELLTKLATPGCRSCIRTAHRDQRSPLVGCSSQNRLASSAFTDPATPARTDRATRTDTIVFMSLIRRSGRQFGDAEAVIDFLRAA